MAAGPSLGYWAWFLLAQPAAIDGERGARPGAATWPEEAPGELAELLAGFLAPDGP